MIFALLYGALALGSMAGAAECPGDMVSLPGFCIDRYEAPNQRGVRPLVAQGADEGEAWCAQHGRRLCTEDEWVRACEGASGRKYPYGNVYKRGVCNDDKEYRVPNWALINKYPAENARRHIDHLNQSEPSGSREGCVSEEGVFDLAGNASEWVVQTKHRPGGHKFGMMGCYWTGCYNMHRPAGIKPGCHGTMNPGHSGVSREFRTYEAGFRCCVSL